MKRGKKLAKRHIITIVSAAAVFVIAAAIVITNLFIPVKYLSAYFISKKDALPSGEMRVTFIDVGYGDSTLIELPDGKTALIDGGNGRRSNELKVLKVLNSKNIDKLDYLVCTSVSAERCGGLVDILKYKKIGKIFMPDCKITGINESYAAFALQARKAKEGGVEVEICRYGEIAFSQEYLLCFLSPSGELQGGEYDKLNSNPTSENINNACASVWLEYGGVAFFLAGDMTAKHADKLYNNYIDSGCFEIGGKKIKLENCNIIKTGNHGDKSCVSTRLYGLLKPLTAIISVGENARGNPSAEALAEAQKYAGKSIYSTRECGTVTISVSGGKYTVSKEK